MDGMNSWVVRPKPIAQARLRLFCFPYAGGGSSIFRAWPEHLPATVEVCSIQLPGRESRLGEPLYTNLEPLVHVLAQSLQPYLDKPCAFFGHSLGALIGFELARTLRQQRQHNLVHLFVSGHSAPQIPNADPSIHQLPQAEFIQKLQALNGTSTEVLCNPELMELFYPVLRADFAMNELYVYRLGSALDCAISAFGGLRDSLVNRSDLEMWREQTRDVFSVRMLPGDHFFIRSARASLLRAIVQDLTQSLSRFERG
jgi:medium-chain acyl-[acyl-carrier-protein] hydrolase